MKSLYYILLLTIIIFTFYNNAQAQYKKTNPYENKKHFLKGLDYDLHEAQFCYSHYWFKKAIPYYEKVTFHYHRANIFSELGDCYSAEEDYSNAARAYKEALKINGNSDTLQLKYAKTLMTLMQYDEAVKWLGMFTKSHPDDRRAANMLTGCSNAKMANNIPSGVAVLEDFNTDGSEFAPTFWNGKLIFTSDAGTGLEKNDDKWSGKAFYNIYTANCDGNGKCGADVDKITVSKNVNIKYHDGPCTFSKDGSQMFFTRTNFKEGRFSKSVADDKGTVHLQIMIADSFNTDTKEFKNVRRFKYNNVNYSNAHATINPSGNLLVYSSDMPGGSGGSDLYICKMVNGEWSEPQNAGKIINTEGEEVFPYFADETTLYFSSDGQAGLGGLDIYVTKWDNNSSTFSIPQNVGVPLNSSYDDISLALFADGKSSYFSSNRPANKKGDNIFYYKRKQQFLLMNFSDAHSGTALTGCSATLNNDNGHDALTSSLLLQIQPITKYTVNVKRDGYHDQSFDIIGNSSKEFDTLLKEVQMQPLVIDTPKPAPPEPEFVEGRNYKIAGFYFEYNKYDIIEDGKPALDRLINVLNRYPEMKIRINAYTDCRGKEAYNEVLSDKRAKSVIQYLHKTGKIDKNRLEFKGMGNQNPEVSCPDCKQCTEEQHQRNRRIEYQVLKM